MLPGITGDEHHNKRKTTRFLNHQKRAFDDGCCLDYVLIFSGLAKSFAKNGGISAGFGRIFEPLVLYIRDEIAIPNIGEAL
jgi:F-type H+-transporting ATPase subunit a